MKILMALTYYYPHWTGLTAFAQRMAEGLAARGHQVTVVTSWYRRDLPREEVHHGVGIVRVPTLLRLSRGQVMPSFPAVVHRLVREHDVVQVHTPMLETWLVGALAHRAGRKMLMTHHGDLVMPAGLWNQFVQKTVGWMLDQGAKAADMISIYTQDYARNSAFLRPHAHKVVAIFPPVVFPRPDLQQAATWRSQLGLDGYRTVGFAGRFVEEKGFDYLLQAMPLVAERLPQVKFLFAGEPNVVYENFYQRCLPLIEAQRDKLVMLGLITDPQKMAQFYAMCDVFVLPSRTDCLASVQVEAMLCGTPVVATNIPGARQAVKRSGMGLLVEPRNPAALAEGLVQALTQRERYLKPYEEIRAIFDPDRSIVQYERLFESMIRGTPFQEDEKEE
jgi:glycosyltransferase involved in cell wall biosynthesis